MSKYTSKIKKFSHNNTDLANKANYIQDESLIKIYCLQRGLNYEEFIKSSEKEEDKK